MNPHRRILLVDDDPALLDVYRDLLAQLPSQPQIYTAFSGALGLAMLGAELFDLLICGLKMPKMDGFEVLSIVREKHPELRMMMLTGVRDPEVRSRAYALGVDQFYNKPGTEKETEMFLEGVECLLKAGRRGKRAGKAALPAPQTRPLRVVVLDDEPAVGQALQLMLRFDFPNASILTFTDAESALRELEREDPDLFTTDWHHAGRLNYGGILEVLASRGAKYPIFVISAMAEFLQAGDDLKRFRDAGLKVALQAKPFLVEDVKRLLSLHLGIKYSGTGNSVG